LIGGTVRNRENSSRNSRSAGWSFNTGRPDYETCFIYSAVIYILHHRKGACTRLISGLGGDRLGTDMCASGF
jgi:hypothetical protein